MFDFLESLRIFLQQPGGQSVFTAVTAIISVVVSVMSPIVAAVVAFLIARKQIRANMVSANRQKWVEEMRSVLSELLAINYVVMHAPQKQNDVDASIKVYTLRHRLRLLTEAGNREHQAINTAVDRLIDTPPSRSYDDGLEQEVVAASHRLFAAELKKVRKGE